MFLYGVIDVIDVPGVDIDDGAIDKSVIGGCVFDDVFLFQPL
jgi:hypothetical protein